ncbi:Endoplasmic reticulum-Golgi intermediate compartment protein 1, partial [Stegodyphus mimosarum]
MPFDVRRFDIYRKIPKDLTQPTLTGAIISVCCCCFIAILFLSEFLHFINISVFIDLEWLMTLDKESKHNLFTSITQESSKDMFTVVKTLR